MLNHPLQLFRGEVKAVIVLGIHFRETLAHLGVLRVLLQVPDIQRRQFRTIHLDHALDACTSIQAGIALNSRQLHGPPGFAAQQHVHVAQSGDALTRALFPFGARKQIGQLLKARLRRVAVLGVFQMPVGEVIQREGDIGGCVVGLADESLRDDGRRLQVLQILRLISASNI